MWVSFHTQVRLCSLGHHGGLSQHPYLSMICSVSVPGLFKCCTQFTKLKPKPRRLPGGVNECGGGSETGTVKSKQHARSGDDKSAAVFRAAHRHGLCLEPLRDLERPSTKKARVDTSTYIAHLDFSCTVKPETTAGGFCYDDASRWGLSPWVRRET